MFVRVVRLIQPVGVKPFSWLVLLVVVGVRGVVAGVVGGFDGGCVVAGVGVRGGTQKDLTTSTQYTL